MLLRNARDQRKLPLWAPFPYCSLLLLPPPSLNGTFHCSMVTMGWGQSFRTGPSFKSRSLLMAPLDQKGDLGRLLSLQSAFFLV